MKYWFLALKGKGSYMNTTIGVTSGFFTANYIQEKYPGHGITFFKEITKEEFDIWNTPPEDN